MATTPKNNGRRDMDKIYFLLSFVMLFISCAIIIAAFVALAYFFYKFAFKREKYFQFDDGDGIHMPKQLEEIKEVDEENVVTNVNQMKERKASDNSEQATTAAAKARGKFLLNDKCV